MFIYSKHLFQYPFSVFLSLRQYRHRMVPSIGLQTQLYTSGVSLLSHARSIAEIFTGQIPSNLYDLMSPPCLDNCLTHSISLILCCIVKEVICSGASLLILVDHSSNAFLKLNPSSLITVTVHGSNVLSPAILSVLPLYGSSTVPTVDAGKFAPLTKKCCEILRDAPDPARCTT